MNILSVAYSIINKYEESLNHSLTHLKLQKLLYYSYVWSLIDGKKLFNESFKKWKFGPVNPEIYDYFKHYHDGDIPSNHYISGNLSQSESTLIEFIIYSYGKFNAITLSSMTHQDEPWKNTSISETISDNSIIAFYSKLNFAKNFPIKKENPYFPVETDLHYSFILDQPEQFSSKPFFYKTQAEYLRLEQKSQEELKQKIDEWFKI